MTERKTAKKCCRWVTVEWEPAAECWMIDIRFETSPPENEWIHMALGHDEMKELTKKLSHSLRGGRQRKPKQSGEGPADE